MRSSSTTQKRRPRAASVLARARVACRDDARGEARRVLLIVAPPPPPPPPPTRWLRKQRERALAEAQHHFGPSVVSVPLGEVL